MKISILDIDVEKDSQKLNELFLLLQKWETSDTEKSTGLTDLTSFLDEKIVTSAKAKVLSKDLYETYVAWCKDNEEKPVSSRSFGLSLKAAGFKAGKTTKGMRCWQGLRLFTTGDQSCLFEVAGEVNAVSEVSETKHVASLTKPPKMGHFPFELFIAPSTRIPVNRWKDVFVQTAEHLIATNKLAPQQTFPMLGSRIPLISKYKYGNRPLVRLSNGLYADVNHSSVELVRRALELMDKCGCSKTDLLVYYR